MAQDAGLDAPVPGCGNGILEDGEGCDDGAQNSNSAADACRTDCVPAGCGDGAIDSGEGCDEGAANSDLLPDACRTGCEAAGCGDGVVDTGELCEAGETTACLAACGSTGTATCTDACVWAACRPPVETCNGLDDDCDGEADSGFTCAVGETESCEAACGTTGTRTCGAACEWGACIPPIEICNGLDDDCDGQTDDGFECARDSTEYCDTACRSVGTRACGTNCIWEICVPPAEECNGVDDDCDDAEDEDFGCTFWDEFDILLCTTACGSDGYRECHSCVPGECQVPGEICNGLDDDCDGSPDNGWSCVDGAAESCETRCASQGTRTCTGCTWSSCGAPDEVCNGRDDDCDGLRDEDFECQQGASGYPCATSCGTAGTRTCSASCSLGPCAPPGERCNGLDDDCDGEADEDFECTPGEAGLCMTACGSGGTFVCNAACTPLCTADLTSICDGTDTDCDGTSDESETLTGAIRISTAGGPSDKYPAAAWSGSEVGLLWVDSSDNVRFQRIAPDGTEVGAELVLATDASCGGVCWRVALCATSTGWAAVYPRGSGSGRLLRLDANGAILGVHTLIDETLLEAAVACGGGQIGVAMRDNGGVSDWAIDFWRYGEEGTLLSGGAITTGGRSYSPSVAWDGTRFGVAYMRYTDCCDRQPYLQLLGASGALDGPALALPPDGINSVVSLAWTGSEWWVARDSSPDGIRLARFGATGTFISQTFVTAGGRPSLAWGNGFAGLAYTSSEHAYFRRLDAGGASAGGTAQLSAAGGIDADYPSVVWLGDSFGVAYEFTSGSGDVWWRRLAVCR